jgi:hypothetical protein
LGPATTRRHHLAARATPLGAHRAPVSIVRILFIVRLAHPDRMNSRQV